MLILSTFSLSWKFTLFAMFLYRSHSCEKSGFWDIGQNALSQLDFRISKPTIPLEQHNTIAWILACWYEFMQNLKVTYKFLVGRYFNIFLVGVNKTEYGHLGRWIVKSVVSQEWTDKLNWLFVCSWWCNNFCLDN